jgi:methylenetetrahydrofolate dehydrogenase (NADP+) / methenyltetrahydrofolate cyclohydrolase
MKILDGKKRSLEKEILLQKKISGLFKKPTLSVILIGDNPASQAYVRMKKRKCEQLGVLCNIINFSSDVLEKDVLNKIDELNNDSDIQGILVQLPLPNHINTRKVLDAVSIKKDVDGLHAYHLMKILLNDEEIIPCTPKGILDLLDTYEITLEGKTVCVVGFSDVVGKPLATMCLNRGATVTVCHVKTSDLTFHTRAADIIMTATGVPNLIKGDMVKNQAIVVDIGISKVDGKIVGDVDFEKVSPKCSFITPVPGGVGPMTVISLIENMFLLSK